jgi:hypothetical protein
MGWTHAGGVCKAGSIRARISKLMIARPENIFMKWFSSEDENFDFNQNETVNSHKFKAGVKRTGKGARW